MLAKAREHHFRRQISNGSGILALYVKERS